MNAFFVIATLFLTPIGHTFQVIKVPFATMELCEEHLADKARVEMHSDFKVADYKFLCEPRKEPETPT